MIELAKTPEVTELVLTQLPHDPTLFELPGIGWIRTGGYFGGSGATITVGGKTWQCQGKGIFTRRYIASDTAGYTLAEFAGPMRAPGRGAITWQGRRLNLTTVGRAVRQLSERGTVYAEVTGTADSARPVKGVLHADDLPSELILFMFYVALERQRQATRNGSSSTDAGGGGSGGGGG